MIGYPVNLTPAASDRFNDWLEARLHARYLTDAGRVLAPGAWDHALAVKLVADSDRRDFEISSRESASGRPELFDFTDEDLVFEEVA